MEDNRMRIEDARVKAIDAGFVRSLSWWRQMVQHKKITITQTISGGRTHNMIDQAELNRILSEKPGLKVTIQ